MQTSKFQLVLVAALALALGISLSSSPAEGYPAGPVVSTGSSPIINSGGAVSTGGWFTVISATEDHDLVVTDVVLSADMSGAGSPRFQLSTGADVGQLFVFGGSYHSGGVVHLNLETGIRIPAGQSLMMDTDTTNTIRYMMSGYLAQP